MQLCGFSGGLLFPTSYACRHTGVCALLGQRLQGSRGVMRYQDGSRLLGIGFCQLHVFSLEFVEFRECSVVVS